MSVGAARAFAIFHAATDRATRRHVARPTSPCNRALDPTPRDHARELKHPRGTRDPVCARCDIHHFARALSYAAQGSRACARASRDMEMLDVSL
jgi:hypothetical protein